MNKTMEMTKSNTVTDIVVNIIGTGSFLPKKVLTNFDLEKIVDTTNEWITTRTGIKERRIAEPTQASSDLAYEAAKQSLEDAKIKPENIDLIIVSTITPDMFFPSTACIIQEKLGAINSAAFDLSAACSGFIYGLATASAFIKSKMYKTILVVASETLSKITDWQDRSTCVLLGDGAGAVVLQANTKPQHQILSCYLEADGKYGDLLNIQAGGSRLPATIETVQQRLHYLKMKGNEVFKIAIQSMTKAAKNALTQCDQTCEKIKVLIPHQANLRIINVVSERLQLKKEQVFLNIERYGNMSAATTAVGLDEVARSYKLNTGDIIELVAFGSGFTSGACVIKW